MITSDMQRQYQLLKESGAHMSLPNLFAGTPEYNDSDFNKVFQEARLTPQDIIALTGGDNAGVSAGEWARLSPEVQQAILNDPGTFLRGQFGKTYGASPYDLEQRLGSKYVDASGNAVTNDDTTYTDDFGKIRRGEEEVFANPNFGDKQWFADQIATNPLTKSGLDPYQWGSYMTNGANGDMLSVGAEGGIKDYQNLKWVPGVGLVRPNSDYMQVHDQDADIAPAIMLALAGMVAGPAFAGALGGTTGGTYATVSDAIAAGDFAAADAMGAAAFDAGGGISGLGSSLGGGSMSQAVELVKAGFPYTEAAKLTGVSEEALFAALDTGAINGSGAVAAGATGVGGTVPNAMTQFGGAAGDAAIAADAAAIGGGTVAKDGWLASVLGTGGADLVKGLAPDLWKAVIGGIATDKQKSDFEALANKASEMANPGAYFQKNTIWPALEEAIKAGNKPNADTLAGLHELMQSGADPNSDLRKQSANGFAAANDLVTNPMGNSGYSLADQAAQLYASLNSDPYSNPLISQTFQNAMEAAARKSAASGRLQGGNFLADSRNATTGAVVDASGKLGTQYGNAINSGMNMYDTQFKDALGLGTGAAGTANQNISAGAQGLGNLANLQQADSNYIAQLGNLAGFGKPENAAAAYATNQANANKTDPWATALYNGGTKIIDGLLTNVFKG